MKFTTNMRLTLIDELMEMMHSIINRHLQECHNEYVGEYYVSRADYEEARILRQTYFIPTPCWQKFSLSQKQDEVEDYIKINNTWHAKKDIVFYKDIYAAQKLAISTRIESNAKK